VLVLAAAGDIFHSLFHPSGRATLSGLVIRRVWRTVRAVSRRRPRLLGLAGPLGVLTAILTWAAMLVVGFALIYWPSLPAGFLLGSGLEPAAHDGFLDAVYVSLVMLSTLGLGDVSPADPALRLVVPAQALMGFGLLTASLTWVLSLYPVLRRMRALAEEVVTLEEATGGDVRGGMAEVGPGEATRIISSLTSQLVAVRTDLVQHELVYYFHEGDRLHSLADALPILVALARHGEEPANPPELRLAGRRLRLALEHVAATLAAGVLGRPGLRMAEAFRAYADEHLADGRAGGVRSA
jgi:hypothetical protein